VGLLQRLLRLLRAQPLPAGRAPDGAPPEADGDADNAAADHDVSVSVRVTDTHDIRVGVRVTDTHDIRVGVRVRVTDTHDDRHATDPADHDLGVAVHGTGRVLTDDHRGVTSRRRAG
jgi:hypothetical protein